MSYCSCEVSPRFSQTLRRGAHLSQSPSQSHLPIPLSAASPRTAHRFFRPTMGYRKSTSLTAKDRQSFPRNFSASAVMLSVTSWAQHTGISTLCSSPALVFLTFPSLVFSVKGIVSLVSILICFRNPRLLCTRAIVEEYIPFHLSPTR